MTPKIMQNIYDTEYYDSLTRLPNLQQFRILSRQIMNSQAMRSQGMAFVYFNLKNLRDLRKTQSLQNANMLIEITAQTIQTTFQGRIVARLSQEHFAVITTNDGLPDRLEEIYDDIHALQHDVTIDLKAGIYLLDPFDTDADMALDKARVACSSINDKADVHFTYYDSKLDTRSKLQSYVREQLRSAIEAGRISPYYQPLADASSGKTCCYEVHAQWQDPVYGSFSPEEYTSLLEEYHLIHELDLCLIRQVCRNYNTLRERGVSPLPVAVRVSKLDLILVDMVREIDTILEDLKVPRSYLHIRIAESAFSMDTDYLLGKAIGKLRGLGYEVWLDDFGSGRSSLYDLRDYPFDTVIIDRCFTAGIEEGSRSCALLSAMIKMLKSLGMKTVVSGADTEEISGILKNIGCDMKQGSCFGRPVSLEELI